MHNWEHSLRPLRIEEAREIARVLDVTLDELAGVDVAS